MKLRISIDLGRDEVSTKEDIKLLEKILRKSGVRMVHIDRMMGQEVYSLYGNEEKIEKTLSRGAGAKSNTSNLKIETILELEKMYYRKPEEKAAALQEYGIGVRRYQQIKKAICDRYGSLGQAIQKGYEYFVMPKIRNN